MIHHLKIGHSTSEWENDKAYAGRSCRHSVLITHLRVIMVFNWYKLVESKFPTFQK